MNVSEGTRTSSSSLIFKALRETKIPVVALTTATEYFDLVINFILFSNRLVLFPAVDTKVDFKHFFISKFSCSEKYGS